MQCSLFFICFWWSWNLLLAMAKHWTLSIPAKPGFSHQKENEMCYKWLHQSLMLKAQHMLVEKTPGKIIELNWEVTSRELSVESTFLEEKIWRGIWLNLQQMTQLSLALVRTECFSCKCKENIFCTHGWWCRWADKLWLEWYCWKIFLVLLIMWSAEFAEFAEKHF